MPNSPSSLPIEIKISTVVAISAILHSADPQAIDSALKQMTGGVSDFFEDEFAVIDVAAIADEAAQLDWEALVALLKRYRLNAVAVRGAPPALHDVIRAHDLFLDDGSSGLQAGRERERAEEAPAAAEPAPAPAPVEAPVPVPGPVPPRPVPPPCRP
jgi:septum site-determining protein MinC